MIKIRVAITGGIGSGKSTFANCLASKGYVVINADDISKDILSFDESIIKKVIKEFGSDSYKDEVVLNTTAGKIDTSLVIDETGNFNLTLPQLNVKKVSVRVFPGLLSIIPPLLAILFALIFRQVILSLILGVYVGAVFIYDYNPLTGLLRLIDKYIINSISDVSHIQILVFTLLFGGVIGLISKSGGTRGIANVITKFAKNRKSTMLSAWLSGLVIFFDDYANTLIVGNLMRPVTDKMKISREKLSFIVDATAAPVASVFIISSWIGYEVGLIQDGLKMIGSDANAYTTFLATIPFRFYPIVMLFFVFLISYTQRDFGPMYKAERRALVEGKLFNGEDKAKAGLAQTSELFGNEEKAKLFLNSLQIKMKNEWNEKRNFLNLSTGEKKTLVKALISEGGGGKLITNYYNLSNFDPISDAKEMSKLLNACGRLGFPSLGISSLMGDKKALLKAIDKNKIFKREISIAIRLAEANIRNYDNINTFYHTVHQLLYRCILSDQHCQRINERNKTFICRTDFVLAFQCIKQ